MKTHEIKQKRAAVVAEARQFVDKIAAESRSWTEDETAKLAAFEGQVEALNRDLAIAERAEQFGRMAADNERSLSPSQSAPGPLSETKRAYSLLRAVRVAMGAERGGLEAEVSAELSARAGRQPRGIFVPWNMQSDQRALTTTTGAGGIATILGTDFIDILRNRLVTNAMGATVMTDMNGGAFALPKQTATTTAYWVAPGNAPTGSNLTVGQVVWTPKTVGAYTDIQRQFFLQTSLDAEGVARADLAAMLARELDRAALNGSGTGNQPLGILQDGNIPTVALGTNGTLPTWANILALESAVAVANADTGKLGYVGNNQVRAVMKATPKVGTTYPVFQWEDSATPGEGRVNGYRAMASQQIPSNLTKGSASGICSALIYGNWESLTYAFWSGLDIMVDPYTGSSSGTVRLVALQDLDIQFRYEASFAKTVDMLTA